MALDREKVDTVHLAEGDPTNLRFNFPGREILQLPRAADGEHPNRRVVNGGNVTVYAASKITNRGGIIRVNLFAELLGVRDHVASAFVTPGAPPAALIVATGFVVDGWHLYAQSTVSPIWLRATMASQECCASPRVRVKKNNLIPPSEIVDINPEITANFITPALVPWGRENGLHNAQSVNAIGPGGATITLTPRSRITHVLAQTDGNGSVFEFLDEFGNTIETFTIAQAERIELFPHGDLQAAAVNISNVDFLIVESVR